MKAMAKVIVFLEKNTDDADFRKEVTGNEEIFRSRFFATQ